MSAPHRRFGEDVRMTYTYTTGPAPAIETRSIYRDGRLVGAVEYTRQQGAKADVYGWRPVGTRGRLGTLSHAVARVMALYRLAEGAEERLTR